MHESNFYEFSDYRVTITASPGFHATLVSTRNFYVAARFSLPVMHWQATLSNGVLRPTQFSTLCGMGS